MFSLYFGILISSAEFFIRLVSLITIYILYVIITIYIYIYVLSCKNRYCCPVKHLKQHLIIMITRAATNDYFDNRLVGRLFFRLIGLNIIIVFY